jgi:hypothetical protein
MEAEAKRLAKKLDDLQKALAALAKNARTTPGK